VRKLAGIVIKQTNGFLSSSQRRELAPEELWDLVEWLRSALMRCMKDIEDEVEHATKKPKQMSRAISVNTHSSDNNYKYRQAVGVIQGGEESKNNSA
jgi:hypothetical protein